MAVTNTDFINTIRTIVDINKLIKLTLLHLFQVVQNTIVIYTVFISYLKAENKTKY